MAVAHFADGSMDLVCDKHYLRHISLAQVKTKLDAAERRARACWAEARKLQGQGEDAYKEWSELQHEMHKLAR